VTDPSAGRPQPEGAGIKIRAVATEILGVSGRAMLTALIDGQGDTQVVAEMADPDATQDPHLGPGSYRHFGGHH
jgi:transposase